MKKIQKIIKKFLAERKISISKKHVAIFLGVVVFAVTVYAVKSLFIVAVVNNTVITRFSLDRELEKQYGQKVLQNRVTEALIMQEAKKQKISITKEELNAEMAKVEEEIKSSGLNLPYRLVVASDHYEQGKAKSEVMKELGISILVDDTVNVVKAVRDNGLKVLQI